VTNLVITEAGVWSSSPKDSQILLWDRKVHNQSGLACRALRLSLSLALGHALTRTRVNQKHRVSKKIKTSGGVNGMLFVAPFHVWSTSQNTVTLWDAKVLEPL
jgi:hypothetical protein